MPRMLTTRQFADKHGVSDSRIRQLLAKNRVYPADKIGHRWVLYANTVIIPPHSRSW